MEEVLLWRRITRPRRRRANRDCLRRRSITVKGLLLVAIGRIGSMQHLHSSIALEDKLSRLMHFLCKQADQGKTVSASVENANGEKFSFVTIGHGGGSGHRGRGMPQAGNHFSSSPPMRGGVMQHPFDERLSVISLRILSRLRGVMHIVTTF